MPTCDPSEPMDEDYDVYDDDLPDDDEGLDDCGMMPSGQCTQAGSEWCDWSCPRGRMRG